MKQSENVSELIESLAKAKLSFTKAKKSGKNNAFNKSGTPYSTIDDILEACNIPLANNGLVVLQDPEFVEGRLVLTTRIYHKSGQWIESALSVKPASDTAQSIAGAITYSKRYALVAMLGLACGEEDDDGNAASGADDPKIPPKMPVPTLASIMAKYIALYKIDKVSESNELMKIYNGAKEMATLENSETYINTQFRKIFSDQRSEEKVT